MGKRAQISSQTLKAVRWISHAMELTDMTQQELSKRTGISRPAISKILSLKIDCRVSTLIILIEGCGFVVRELKVSRSDDCVTHKIPDSLQPAIQ